MIDYMSGQFVGCRAGVMVRSLVLHLPVKLAGWFAHKIKFLSGPG